MTFGRVTSREYEGLGTTPPIFVPRDGPAEPVRPGKDYFYVQIHAAQAAFHGSIFTRAKRLIVASTVSVSHSGLKESLQSIQRSRAIRPDTAENLGIRSNLIGLVPAVMTDFTISIDFILDQQDRLAQLGTLINDNTFQSILSLAPGAGLVATTVSRLALKVIQTFIPTEDQRPILQFIGDFDLAASGVLDGYQVILGSQDPANPIPRPLPAVQVSDGEVLLDGRPVTQYSYVVIEIRRAAARTRDLNDGAPWETKLREAEDEAQFPGEDTKASWERCRTLLREAQTLLRADSNYLREESDAIVLSVLSTCKARLKLGESTRGRTSSRRAQGISASDLKSLSLPKELDVPAIIGDYAERVMDARNQLSDLSRA